MSRVVIAIEDTPDGKQNLTVDFGDEAFNVESNAHKLAAAMLGFAQSMHDPESGPAEFEVKS